MFQNTSISKKGKKSLSTNFTKINMKTLYALLMIILLHQQASFAAMETYSQRAEGSAIVVSLTTPLFSVYDSKYYTMNTSGAVWQNTFRNFNVKNKIQLGLNPEVAQTNALTGSVDLKIVSWKWNAAIAAFAPTTINTNLAINYDQTANAIINELATYTDMDAHRIDVYITAINNVTNFDVNDIYLSAEIEVDRRYLLDNSPVASLSYTTTPDNYLEINWNHKTGAEYYELEWVHVSSLTSILNTYAATGSLNYDYYLNSTRITLKDNFYKIPKIFDNGYIVYRVRPIGFTGTNFDIRKEGTWTNIPESGLISTHNAANIITVSTEYDTKMNWAHSVTYGDFGERFESIGYMDGLGRGHQGITHDIENKQIFVSNTYYDKAGRPVIQDLSTPVSSELMTHQANFNKIDVTLAPFDYTNFETYNQNPCTLFPYSSTPMSTTSGASKYYSSNNPLATDGENARIPDSEKYPYSRITYMNDMTNRIKSTSGIGKDFKTGSGHELSYLYSAVNQNELNKLFGAESGTSDHYQKMITVDQNGQVYVQIYDLAGRTVVSYMTGQAPTGMDAIEGNNTATELIQYLPGNNQTINTSIPSSTFTHPEYIPGTGTYTFSYGFTPQQFQSCMTNDICFDCVYDLTFKIIDQCGAAIYTHTMSLIGQDLNNICEQKPSYSITPNITLDKGLYTIAKTLSVNQQTSSDKWCTYLNNNTCLNPLSSYFNEAYNNEPFKNCDPSADEQLELESCDAYKAQMLDDLEPGGQYAKYIYSVGTYSALVAGSNIHSVLTLNSLGTNKDWKHPFTPYLNGDLTTAYVNGILPQNLSLSEFIINFQPKWAESLLPYHPEYCFLSTCQNSLTLSNNYDNAMVSITAFSTAATQGFFKPLGSAQIANPLAGVSTTTLDPFFQQSPQGPGWNYYSQMSNNMTSYFTESNVNYSMWQYAIYIASCQGQGTIANCLSNWQQDGAACDLDYIWRIFKELYLTEKKIFVYNMLHSQQNCNNDHIGVNSDWLDFSPVWGNVNLVTDASGNNIDIDGNGPDTGIQPDMNYVNVQIAQQCTTACTAYANEWLATLEGCEQIAALSSANYNNLKNALINLCAAGCNSVHPTGSSTSPTGQTIDDVLALYLGSNWKDGNCSGWLISNPGPYQTTEQMEDAMVDPLDVCACSEVMDAKYEHDHNNPQGLTLEQLIAKNTGVSLENATQILCTCQKVYAGTYTPGGQSWVLNANTILAQSNITVPSSISCPTQTGCTSCATIQTLTTQFNAQFQPTVNITESNNYESMLSNYLNYSLHYNLTPNDYTAFLNKCTATALDPYCEFNPLLSEWAQISTLLNYQGDLVHTSSPANNLLAANIVYKNGQLRQTLNGNDYWTSAAGNTLTQYFGTSSANCTFSLELPTNATFGFNNIISFESVSSLPSDPSSQTQFQVKVKYLDCGEIKEAYLKVTTTCLNVNTCVSSNEGLLLCNTMSGQDDDICYQPRLNELYQNALTNYLANISDLYQTYTTQYNAACQQAFSTENLSIEGPFNSYQYTLFYYDQPGNLVKTVAPKGAIGTFNTSNVNDARNSVLSSTTYSLPTSFLNNPMPVKTYETKYAYNSFNQIVNTSNPDQDGITQYWYDRYGRIIASQNPVQADDNKFSYILYDGMGRPKEAGQIDRDLASGGQITAFDETLIKANDKGNGFKNWVYSGTRSEVRFTYYDEPVSTAISNKFNNGQQNLRLSVASVLYFDNVTALTNLQTDYASAIHYSYDIHGNVIETLQDVPALVPAQQDIKSTQYDFELLSGKVNKVEYQKGKRDQITHEYIYDKLYRLAEVFTSTDDGIHKSREAHYRYFGYGPLSRIEIGQHKVQGLDYAYTINGWMKGLNSTALMASRDGGKDGSKNFNGINSYRNELVATDVMGYSLGYFDDDYKGIGAPTFEADPYVYTTGIVKNPMWNAQSNLYNGNIAQSVMAIESFTTQGYIYKYDQLNRLKSTRTFTANNLSADNNWQSAAETQNYATSYTYDKNGNLTTLNRNATTAIGLNMDQLTYNFASINSKPSNRLETLNEAVPLTINVGDDIDLYVTGNNPNYNTSIYNYDKIGQMTYDYRENLEMKWRKGDKKLASQTKGNTLVEFKYNPLGQRILKIIKGWNGTAEIPQSTQPWKYTYYTYDANGQVMATYSVTMNGSTNIATVDELNIYGTGRIGLIESSKLIYNSGNPLTAEGPVYTNQLGRKRYELTNHINNVNAVITDRKTPQNNNYFYAPATFNSSTEGWTVNTPNTVTQSNGQITININGSSGTTNNTVGKTFATTVGEEYDVTVTASGTAGMVLQAIVNGTVFPITNGVTSNITFTANVTSTPIKVNATTMGTYTYSVQDILVASHAKYYANTVVKTDFYAYGYNQPGRTVNNGDYTYGYNGMMKDNEAKGNGNSYTTEFRQYDPRLGRWLSLDPLKGKYPNMSPYCAFNNNPVYFIDPTGLIGEPAHSKLPNVGGKDGKKFRIEYSNPYLAAQNFARKTGGVIFSHKGGYSVTYNTKLTITDDGADYSFTSKYFKGDQSWRNTRDKAIASLQKWSIKIETPITACGDLEIPEDGYYGEPNGGPSEFNCIGKGQMTNNGGFNGVTDMNKKTNGEGIKSKKAGRDVNLDLLTASKGGGGPKEALGSGLDRLKNITEGVNSGKGAIDEIQGYEKNNTPVIKKQSSSMVTVHVNKWTYGLIQKDPDQYGWETKQTEETLSVSDFNKKHPNAFFTPGGEWWVNEGDVPPGHEKTTKLK